MAEQKPKRPSSLNESTGSGTKAVWAGEEELFGDRATQVPVCHSVSFGYDDMDEWFDVATGKKEGHIYSRNTNPTIAPLEDKLAQLEGSKAAVTFATGMAAISNTLFTFLSPGDRVVAVKDTYGGTNKIFIEFLPRFNIEVVLCDTLDHEQIEREVKKGCKLLYLETPTNPTLKVIDIARLSQAAHDVGALVAVDNTFATPINQKPLELGADLTIYSLTKFMGGHSDAMGGAVCASKDLVHQVFHFREINGATLHPMSAYLLLRGLKTLELRIQRHNENAQAVAEFLAAHPKVEQVFYPGLKEHTNHDVATKQMQGYGGMLSFSLKDGFDAVRTFLPRLNFAHRAASLGSVGTLVGPPRTTSHVELTAEERAQAGIPESLIRYSAGIENKNDLIADLEQAFQSI